MIKKYLSARQPAVEELFLAEEFLYNPCGFKITNLLAEAESQEYNATTFLLNQWAICYRKAKITPTKTGQFVTFWKRSLAGPIAPFEQTDPIDFFIVTVKKENQLGQFIFPKSIFDDNGIIKGLKAGKRALRVYPPWDCNLNKQAQKTQAWQLPFFIAITEKELVNIPVVKAIFQKG